MSNLAEEALALAEEAEAVSIGTAGRATRQRETEEAARALWARAKSIVLEAAARGERTITVDLMEYQSTPRPTWAHHLALAATALFEADGFRVTERSGYTPPGGDLNSLGEGYWLRLCLVW